ncbi:TIGR00366 family protein [Bacillus smithii 7_3_47FAA]|uniref:TIGR00366 family protein n=1 Tax=Bacillus smithii 7_3_47FAA TaxID=665952 RepID=G9QI12_9BACI|nr:TIGR00366 family protein [Bacillus smithii 7_3_47FAA]
MEKLTNFFTNLMRKYLPDPFVFAIGLTLLTMILSIVVEGQGFKEMTLNWGNGFWDLLAFTAQMAVILAAGYVLATSPLIDKLLNKIASKVRTPKAAIIVATLVGGIGCYLNWGFGLVIGSVMAKKLAVKVKGVHYPLIIASAYSGFTLYGLGLSASIPVLISTPGHPMEKTMGVIPLSETIFSPPVIMTSIVLIITLPMLNAMLHPKRKENIIEINPSAFSEETGAATEFLEENTLANKLNNSRLLSFIIGIIGIIYVCIYFMMGIL